MASPGSDPRGFHSGRGWALHKAGKMASHAMTAKEAGSVLLFVIAEDIVPISDSGCTDVLSLTKVKDIETRLPRSSKTLDADSHRIHLNAANLHCCCI